jgi:hypothetical protein
LDRPCTSHHALRFTLAGERGVTSRSTGTFAP